MDYEIPGWMNNKDLEILSHLASCVQPNGNILEIGPFLGRSTSALVDGKKDSVVIDTVDTFLDIPVDIDSYFFNIRGNKEKFNQLRTLAMSTGDWEVPFRICQSKNIKKINVHKCKSQEFKINKTYDLTFIDGNHSFQSVFDDIKKFINNHGIIAGDDYHQKFSSVQQAVSLCRTIYNRTLLVPKDSKIWILVPDIPHWQSCAKNLI